MFQKVFALGLVASACAAAPAAGTMRLRGGFAGYGKLTDMPSKFPHVEGITYDFWPLPVLSFANTAMSLHTLFGAMPGRNLFTRLYSDDP